MEGEITVITREQAEEADYNLSPGRWVGETESDNEADIHDIIGQFEAVVAEEAAISAKLVAVIQRLRSLE